MRAAEIRELRDDEIKERLSELQRQLFTLRCQVRTERLENVRAIRNLRKDIARVKTIIKERELQSKQ